MSVSAKQSADLLKMLSLNLHPDNGAVTHCLSLRGLFWVIMTAWVEQC